MTICEVRIDRRVFSMQNVDRLCEYCGEGIQQETYGGVPCRHDRFEPVVNLLCEKRDREQCCIRTCVAGNDI
jgi:hypothetical protein